jgi:hypothetical protein
MMNMIKKILLVGIAIIIAFGALIAQDNVGFGTTTPHSSALLDMTAPDKGLLIPRVELVDVNNGTNPVNGPATGLLVFNETGALDEGFYYWDGAQWVMVGAGGGSSDCVTLDEAYDCGGNGAGSNIIADVNPVNITLPAASANEDALVVESYSGTTAVPTSAIRTENTMHGTSIFSQISDPTNPYGAIQAVTFTNLTGGNISTGVSGYHLGTGIGAGVWGEASSNSPSGSSYGVYGRGTNKTFGGYFYGANWPGGFVETGDATSQAFQLAAAGQNPLNPGMLSIGSAQFNCGNSGGAVGNIIILNNQAGEATLGPDNGGWGYIGNAGLEWWAIYTSNPVQVSRRELKRDITYFDENLSSYVMNDIMKLKPTFYKYKA